jgi:hypothetical protein
LVGKGEQRNQVNHKRQTEIPAVFIATLTCSAIWLLLLLPLSSISILPFLFVHYYMLSTFLQSTPGGCEELELMNCNFWLKKGQQLQFHLLSYGI